MQSAPCMKHSMDRVYVFRYGRTGGEFSEVEEGAWDVLRLPRQQTRQLARYSATGAQEHVR